MKAPRLLAVFLLCLSAGLRAESGTISEPTWQVVVGSEPGASTPLHEEGEEVEIIGATEASPDLRVHGVFRTRQAIDTRSALSYHLYTSDGSLILFDGPRSPWRSTADGWLEADFSIENDTIRQTPGLQPGLRVQFDYVVEGEYWQSRRFPASFLPSLEVLPPPRPAFFEVGKAWVPPVFPANTRCRFPVWVKASYGLEPPPPYLASPDLLSPDGAKRVESPRAPFAWEGDGCGVVWYRFEGIAPQKLQLRPGFVWEGVEWFAGYRENPYRPVWVLGTLVYLGGMIVLLLVLRAGARLVNRQRSLLLRRVGWAILGCAIAYASAVVAVSYYGLVFVALAALLWMQDHVREPGPRLYWTMWGLLVLLDLYCLHIHTEAPLQWAGSATSAAFTALLLLPLRLVRRRNWAAGVGTGLAVLVALIATSMMVYRGFFGDYPGVSDLLNAGQVEDVGDSVWNLLGQPQLVPWVFASVACWGLWRK